MHVRATVPATALLAFCLIAGSRAASPETKSGIPAKPDDKTVVHVLNRLGFGPSPGAIERVGQIGLAAYIEQQLHPERVADPAMAARLSGFTTLTKSSRQLAEEFFVPALMARREQQGSEPAARRSPEALRDGQLQRTPMAELAQQKILRAAYSERQLEEALVDFWFNHFNVFAGKGQVRTYLTEYERDAIRPHVFGRFRDLLGATAASPAMLFYLDNWQSSAAEGAATTASAQQGRRSGLQRGAQPRRNGAAAMAQRPQQARRRGLNENYARELMELHTIGVDGGYTQKDVQEVARAFTGWTIESPRAGGGFRFDPRLHDDGEKTVLGQRIAAGGGQRDGEQLLDLLAKHPSTARFIATKLARRFVSDDPPPALVARAAERFSRTDGDIREVVRTIVTSPEFFAPEAYRAKVKTPFEFVVSAVRATGGEVAGGLPLVVALRDLGMPLYGAQPPTGYVDRADVWVNSGALLNRMNFAVAFTSGRVGQGARSPSSSRLERRAGVDDNRARRRRLREHDFDRGPRHDGRAGRRPGARLP